LAYFGDDAPTGSTLRMIDFTKMPAPTRAPAAGLVSPAVLAELEAMRRGAAGAFYAIFGGTLIVAAVVASVLVYRFRDVWPVWGWIGVGFASLVLLLIAAAVGTLRFVPYVAAFKCRVIAPLVQKVDSRLTYSAEGGVDEADFNESELYDDGPRVARYATEDSIKGTIDGVAIEMSEVHAESKHTRSTKNGTETYYKTIFKGILFVATLPERAPGHVVIRGMKRGLLGGPAFPRADDPRIEDVHPELDARFAVFSENAPLGRGFALRVGPHLLRLAESRPKADVRAAYADGRIFIAVEVEGNQLEPPYFSSVEKADLGALLAQIRGFVGLADVLQKSRTPTPA
jgi:hypothetical protein